jgi:hypothetical protein
VSNRSHRPIPRLLSPRLPIGRRWVTFCRSNFAKDLRTATAGTMTTLTVTSSVVVFYFFVHVLAVLHGAPGGAA